MGIPEKIKAIKDEIGRTQLNKATEHHIGLLKAKIANAKTDNVILMCFIIFFPILVYRLELIFLY